ncbi:Aste57867_20360 [Aphanomyces stellatus]|uniref:Aste57867_20360 protein n=1 Tax=Aphanomyces stellatus TaxID=120398 RepID=A0A485LER6_9STRA|nr:hypothetical protein As57867_020294 [Aphanomyces stellatus]VFT97047.1 Aste57867_20360 [Aphanomyces stellatus]
MTSFSVPGEFIRKASTARHVISSAAGSEFPVEAGRYHLYIAFNCPWCHRTALTRALLGLEDVVTMDVASPIRSNKDHPTGENNWLFEPDGTTALNGRFIKFDQLTPDTVNGLTTARQIYDKFGVDQTSLPILFDKKAQRIVNNESSEIIRMFATELAPALGNGRALYPTELAAQIDELNEWIYPQINNGAYRAGFTSNQDAYEAAFHEYFAAFAKLDKILSTKTWLTGETLTEADVRLFPTVLRHDPIYYVRMKLNHAYVRDAYPNLNRWLKQFYALPGVAENSPLDQMKQGYFGRTWNNTVPVGPTWFTKNYLMGRRTILHRIDGRRHGPGGLINRLVSPEDTLADQLKPFVFIDNVAGDELPPNFGFGFHPHSGIATLTYQLNKDVQYTDTEGHDGVLKALGLEWMMAGGGAWHRGTIVGTGPIMAFQLWLTLPPALEDGPSLSQYIAPDRVPQVDNVRVLMGAYKGVRAAFEPPTPMTYLDVTLAPGESFTFDAPGQQACWTYVFEGAVDVGDVRSA